MKKLSEFVTKNKTQIGVLLLCFIVLIVACIYYVNNSRQTAIINTPKEKVLKAQLDTAPEGYTAITTKEQLATIKDNLSGKYILMADLDMTDVAYEIIGQTSSAPFKGTFDGNYHKISNLKIESANQYIGMFGYINGGTIENLTLENVNITGTNTSSYAYVGGLVGYSNNGTINNVCVKGQVSAKYNVGGLAGYNTGKITNAYVEGKVIGTNNYVGGLVGENISGTITSSYAIAQVSGITYVGGLSGSNTGTITNTYATGKVSGTNEVGGLVGRNYNGTITNTYAVGEVTGTGANVGGLIGYTNRTLTNSYYAKDTTKQLTNIGGEGKFFSSMLNQSTYQNWDFSTIWEIEERATLPYLKGMAKPESVKKENYTYINWEGEGTEENPYLIKTVEELNAINYSLSTHYKLANDINMQDKTFEIIAKTQSTAFTGTFDGDGHKISNLKIESDNQYIGMFGYINGGKIKNLGLEKVDIKGTNNNSYTGGIVGQLNSGTIENSYVTGEVKGTSQVGGLVGYLGNGTITNTYVAVKVTGTGNYIGGLVGYLGNSYAKVSNSYSTGTVTGTSYVGGLVGRNTGTITNTYVIGVVTGTSYAGGLIGENTGTITNTYAIGPVSGTSYVGGLIGNNRGTVTNSYWAVDITTQTVSSGGEGKFFSSMLKQATFKNWDFNTVWEIEEGTTLPYLKGMAKPEGIKAQNYTYTEWEGEGTEENPYLIKTAEQLNSINNLLSGNYKLANDIDMTGKAFEIIAKTQSTAFIGTFDGDGHKITNLTIESDDANVGMFGYVNVGKIKNLVLENVNIKSTGNNSNTYLGGLVGYNYNGTIENIVVKGNIINNNSIINNLNIGGIIGYSFSGRLNYLTNEATIINSKNTDLKASNVGGIVGNFNGNSTNITKSVNNGEIIVKGKMANVGGIVGNSGEKTGIQTSYSTGKISVDLLSTAYVGGIAGKQYNSSVSNSYSTTQISGKIEQNGYVGGLIGNTSGYKSGNVIYSSVVTNSYAIGKINVQGENLTLGGLIANTSYCSIANSYWSQELTGIETSATTYEKPLLTQIMFKQESYNNWNFGTIWGIKENGQSMPYLLDLPIPEAILEENTEYFKFEGEGTEENPYLIDNVQKLQKINFGLGSSYKLVKDLDMTDEVFEPIGQTMEFTGIFDGNGHKITNLTIESDDANVGMFGRIGSGTVKNLGLENVNITGTNTSSYAYVGGIVGYFGNGTITNTYVTGKITGTSYVGGIVGYVSYSNGIITNSYVSTTVTGGSYIGGLVGRNTGKITNAYATGAVSGTSCIGGLIGENTGTITNSYAIGPVSGTSYIGGLIGNNRGTVTNSYWAVNTTKQAISAGGEGKFFSSMLKENTYKNWDFNTVWEIEENATLPHLKGMSKPEDIKAQNYTYVNWEGEGTSTNPYLIKVPQHLKEINYIPSAYYQVANDIDMTDETFEPIGTSTIPFTGTFDGNGHKITNLTIITEKNNVGMFGSVNKGTIRNFILENINIVSTISNNSIGGLIGYNNGTISKVCVTGRISGTQKVGGLVGYNSGSISNTYSTANVNGTQEVGGLVGYNTGSISNTYSIGEVSAESSSNIGGLIGYSSSKGTVYNSYWALDTSGQSTSSKGEGKTIQELLQQTTYQNWDFTTIWEMEEGHILPYLKGMPKPEIIEITTLEGKGTQEDPYLIKTPEELQMQNVSTAYYKLANDIDASQIENYTPGIFYGTFDGDNHTISNLTIKSSSKYTGLFKENGGTIKNLKLNNVNIESNYNGETSYISGVCAYNKGTIKNVEVNGTIKNIGNVTNLYIGQIVGYNENPISKIHSDGSIINEGTVINGYVGGITGYNDSSIRISYNTGNISLRNIENLKVGGIAGKSFYVSDAYSKGNINVNVTSATIGGIVGENVGTVRNTYSVENIEKSATTCNWGGIIGKSIYGIKSSYYNNPSIIEQDGKGTLTTIEELKQKDTFENWDFDNVWSIEENINMPVFQDIFENDEDYYGEDEYEADSYWEWHTRTTTSDQAYNGKHIVINKGKSIDFYGYGVTSYKDYLYKYYDYAGEKTFSFTIEEVRTDYHTLEGAGFIFNASKIDNKLSGYVLIIGQNDIRIYRLDNVNATAFETTDNKTVANYGTLIATGKKIPSSTHKLIIKTSPTNVTVIDSEEEVINQNLDYTKHAGEDFGLIVSYTNHNCPSLSQIHFLGLNIDVKDYNIPVLKTDEIGNKLEGAKFQVKNAEGEIIREGITNSKGTYNIKGLQEGIYTLEEMEAPKKHAFNNYKITFKITNDGKVLDVNTDEEIEIEIVNERLKFEVKVVDTNGNPIPNSKVNLYDTEGNIVLGSDGQPIVVTTGSDGTATITDIEAGTYTFKQTETPSDYILNDTIYTVEIAKDGTVTFKEDANGTIVNKKYGNVTIIKYKEGTTIGVEGAVIEIKDASGKSVRLTTNENGIITFKAFPGTYTYKETTAPDGYILNNTEYTFTVADDGIVTYDSANGIIYNTRVTMKDAITITKYKTGTEMPVAGAVIGVFDAEGNKISEQTTKENGTITISGLEVGSYYYKEISAPKGYVLNNTEYHFTVENDGSVTFAEGTNKIIYNDRVTMSEGITITKYRKNTTIGLPGATIAVFDADGNKVAEKVTGENGQVTFADLEVGSYYYKEISAPAGYVLNSTEYHFTVENDGSVTFAEGTNKIIYNDRVTMSEGITITKYRKNTTTPLAGATIAVFDADGNKVAEKVTGENGQVTFTGLEVGSYYYKEISAPEGYVLNNTEYHFTVNNDGTVTHGDETTFIIYNSRVTMGDKDSFTVTKYRTETEVAVSGAVIGIFDAEGNEISRQTTGESGTITISGLEVGSYYYKEISAPKGYVLNNTEYHFTVENDGSVTFAEGTNKIIYNDRVTMSEGITITKYRTNTTIGLPGATIAVFDADGNKVAEKVTGENGQVTFADLEVGSYYYKEISAPAGYVLNSTEYHFTVENDGSVTFAEGTNKIIYNDRVTMSEGITITKYRKNTTTPLAGATIAVFDADGNKVAEKVTGENGQVTFTGLEVGSYYYKEISAPAGYVLNSTEYHFTVENDGSVTFAEGVNKIIYNDRVTMSEGITITKYRKNTTIGLPGATIAVFDADGNKVAEKVTGENGQVTFADLEVGSYYYKEISAPAGYILNNTEYHFTVENDGTVTLAEGTNKVIYNTRVTMGEKDNFTVTKYRTGTEIALSGAVIGIFDAEGNEISRQTTGESGTITISGLEVGEYYYKEISAPAGYVLNSTEYHFTVNNDGSVTFAEGTNKVIYNTRVTMGEKDNFTVTKYRTGTEIALSGAVIGIFDAEGNEISRQTTKENGTITISGLEVGEYYYKEISAPAGYVLNNTEYHFTVENDGTVTLAEGTNKVIYNTRVTMGEKDNFTVTKYRTGTEIALSGAVIGIFDADGNEISRQTTGENGTITISGLEVGSYYYKEISAPAGYVLNSTEYHFTVENDGTVTHGDETTFIIYNDRVTMSEGITITKYRTNTTIGLPGATIAVFDADGNKVAEKVTGENGQVTFTGLEVGSYYYKEISAPAGYVLNSTEYHFTVENDGTVTHGDETTFIIYNSRVTMGDKDSFTVTKYRTETEVAVSGAVIGIFDAEGNEISRQTTGESGTITISGLEVGSYYYKEISAPAGYVLNSTEYHFTVNNDGTVTHGDETTFIIYNDRVTMSEGITITKYRTNTTIGLPGATIGVFDVNGNKVAEKVTGENGQVTFTGLEVGSYYYKEISAPEGYVLNNTEYHFTVNNDGTVTHGDETTFIIYNDRVTMSEGITITKYRTNTTIGLPGATIAVFDADGNKVAEKVTGENGQVTFADLEVGSYYYKEISAPAGYVLNSTEYHFAVENDGSVTLAEGTTKVIYNDREIVYGDVTIRKYITDTQTPLAGAVIGIYRADGTPITDKQGNPVQLTTNELGTITFKITPGTYMYKEITAPTGYVLDSTGHTFTVSEDGVVTFDSANGIIYNTKVTMHDGLVITKYKTGTEMPIAGAIIGVFDGEGKEVARATTNEAGQVTFTGLEVGNYYYKEISAPTGYVLNSTEYHFTVENDGTVTAGESTTFVIYNDRVTMSEGLTITKYKTGTEMPIAGAIIGVFDGEGKEVARATTNEAGQVTFTGLEVGNYYYKEISAPTGYVLNSTEYHFTVENDGTVKSIGETNFVIYNNRVKAEHTVITKYVTDTTLPVSGAVIGLFDVNGNKLTEQTTNEKGQIDFTGLEPGTYKYKELIAPDGYILNETMYTFTIAEDGTVTFDSANGIIYNDKVTMKDSFIITKKKTGTDTLVSGAIIGVFDGEGKEVARATTNEAGQVTFTGLEVGNYYYKEISAPAGYILNNTEYHFTVENDGTVTLAEGTTKVIYNDRVSKDHIIITKYVTDTTIPVQGAVIGLFDASGNKLAEQITNENGQVDFAGLEPGTYKYKELTAPDGYILNETMYTFTIAKDGTVTFDSANGIIYNTRVTMRDELIITKYRTNTEVGLPGAVIGVFDANGKEVARETTGENGTVTFTGLEVGNYYYKEISAPTGYVLNSTEYHFTVENDGTVTFAKDSTKVIYNDKLTVDHVIITKYEEGTKVVVGGAVIGLFDASGNKLVEQTTNEKGQVDFTGLEPGTYKYKELIAPNGYVLNDTIYTFTIAENGTVIFDTANGIIYNKKKEDKPDIPKVYGDVTLVKYEEGTTIRVEGAIIGIYDKDGNPIKNEKGNVIQFITNEYGEAKFKIRPGTYQYKELKAPNGYILNETTYTFTVAEDGTVTFKENTNGIIYNKKKEEKPDIPEVYGNITIVKYEEGTKKGLKGAIIGIYDSNKKEVKITTKENGTINFKAKPGVYQYQELVAPDGYELDSTIYTFTVTKTGEVIFDNDTKGIIYDKKKEEKPDIPDTPDKPDVPDKPVTPENPKGNTIIPGENTTIKEQPENMVNGRLPQTGETEGMVIITLILAVFGIYFGIKIRNKQ